MAIKKSFPANPNIVICAGTNILHTWEDLLKEESLRLDAQEENAQRATLGCCGSVGVA